MGMDEVFHKLADDHEGKRAALLLHAAVDGVRHLFEIGARVARLDDEDAGRGKQVIIYRDARRVHGALDTLCLSCGFGIYRAAHAGQLLLRRSRDVPVVGRGVARVDKGVEIIRHQEPSLLRIGGAYHVGKFHASMVPQLGSVSNFPQGFKRC